MRDVEGSILTPDGWRRGRLRVEDCIVAIDGEALVAPTAPYLLPGFVDLHVHGGGGADTMAGEAAVRTLARCHAQHGTTSLLATTVTAPAEDIDRALDGIQAVQGQPGSGEAQVLGAHLEGPFLNPQKLGAQPPFAIAPDLELVERWCKLDVVRVMTLAPECDPGALLLRALVAHGVRPQLGHTLCTHAQAQAAIASGCGVTHLFNAMSRLDHRAPGAVGGAFAFAEWAEIIPDLVHVDGAAILAARRAITKLYAVTDATAGAGMPDGDYPLGRHTAHKRGGVLRLSDGSLAGSSLTMDQALRNLVKIGLPLAEASLRTATLPADWLGLEDRGRLSPGLRADLVVVNDALELEAVMIGGETLVGELG